MDDARTISLGPNFYYHAVWSPDSKSIVLVDKTMSIYILALEDAAPALKEVAVATNDPSMGTQVEVSSQTRDCFRRNVSNDSNRAFGMSVECTKQPADCL